MTRNLIIIGIVSWSIGILTSYFSVTISKAIVIAATVLTLIGVVIWLTNKNNRRSVFEFYFYEKELDTTISYPDIVKKQLGRKIPIFLVFFILVFMFISILT